MQITHLRFALPAALIISLASPVRATPVPSAAAARLGPAAGVLDRVDPDQRRTIEELLGRLDEGGIQRLKTALQEFDKYSTFGKTLGTMSTFLMVVGFPTVGIITWGHASNILGGMMGSTVAGSLAAWAGGAAVGVGAVLAGSYALHRYHLRPQALKKLNDALNELRNASSTVASTADFSILDETPAATLARP